MIDYVYGYDEIVVQFVAQLMEHARFGNCKTIGVIDNENGGLIAGVVFHNWNPDVGIIEMSAAALPGRRWFTRETLQRVWEYPFVTCECQMLMSNVAADNEELLGMLARGGYMFVRVPRMFGRERDGVICLLTREEWERNPLYHRRHPLDIPAFLRRVNKEAA